MLKRYFNIAGPCNPKDHYMIDVFERGGNDILELIKEGHYYVVHAARQSGANEGWLVVFDRNTKKPWEEKIYKQTETYNGKQITVVGV